MQWHKHDLNYILLVAERLNLLKLQASLPAICPTLVGSLSLCRFLSLPCDRLQDSDHDGDAVLGDSTKMGPDK